MQEAGVVRTAPAFFVFGGIGTAPVTNLIAALHNLSCRIAVLC